MEVSKAYTTSTYDIERQQEVAKSLARAKKGKKPREARLTERERIREDLTGVWLKYINKKGDTETFLDEIVDYILKNQRR